MRQASFSLFSVIGFTLVGFLLAGCNPPEQRLVDSGHKIIKVEAKTAPPFQTRVIDGVEFKESRSPVGRFGGTYYAASIGRSPKTFNPLASKDATSSTIGGLMFSGLTDTDAYSGDTIPHLARSVELKPDNVTYIVTLRKGLEWSDGKPITADDVVFTWNSIIKEGLGNPSHRDVILIDGKLPSVRKIDNLTIEFKTPAPFAPFQQNLGDPIFPKHIVEPVIRNNPKAFDSFWGVTAKPSSFVVNG